MIRMLSVALLILLSAAYQQSPGRHPPRVPDQVRRVIILPIDIAEIVFPQASQEIKDESGAEQPTKCGGPDRQAYVVTLNGQGDENSVSFTIEWDTEMTDMTGLISDYNDVEIDRSKKSPRSGQIGLVFALPPGKTFNRNSKLATLLFDRASEARSTRIQFSDSVVKSEVGTVKAKSIPAVFLTEAVKEIKQE